MGTFIWGRFTNTRNMGRESFNFREEGMWGSSADLIFTGKAFFTIEMTT
jgi:hypothetical protein